MCAETNKLDIFTLILRYLSVVYDLSIIAEYILGEYIYWGKNRKNRLAGRLENQIFFSASSRFELGSIDWNLWG